jgi:hypothetical protein
MYIAYATVPTIISSFFTTLVIREVEGASFIALDLANELGEIVNKSVGNKSEG